MSSAYFLEVRKQLARYDWASGDGVSAVDIAQAEQILGRFPQDYKAFLGEFGWLRIEGLYIYGMGRDVPSNFDVVRLTIAERTEPAVPLPTSFVCVMNDGAGNLISFDTETVDSGSDGVPILFWDHELDVNQEPEILAPSFHRWLTDMAIRGY